MKTKPDNTEPEPWLRGVPRNVDPFTGHLLRASEHIREDAEKALSGLTLSQLWATPHGMTSAGFHAKHLAGSTERLCTYLAGASLTDEQIRAVALEGAGNQSAAELLGEIRLALLRYENLVRELRAESFGSLREVGRRRLPVTAVSLAIHIAEHGQRHTGQLVSAARLARATTL